MSCRVAYLLERYPAFTQTFIVREVEEMRRHVAELPVVSLRAGDAASFSPNVTDNVLAAPESEALVAEIKRRRAAGELPKAINQRLEAWGGDPDKLRLYEAIWAGDLLKKRGVRHIHVHFAGLAARTACLIKELYGISFSFTGHAQDIFCKTEHAIGLGKLIREASGVVTVADFSAARLQFTYPALANKIGRIYNGIAIPATLPERRESATPLIVSVGRLIEKKGFASLIEACAVLQKKGVAFRCQIVGDGPLESELGNKIAARGLATIVELIGSQSQSQIADLLTTARVFALAAVVLPDGDSDNLPTVITEAMAAGLPVVATRVAGIPEQVIDGETGFLVEPDNIEQLAEKLEAVLTDAVLAQTLGNAGFERAQAKFSLVNTVGELRDILPFRPWWKFF